MKQKAKSELRRKVRKGKEESSATNGAHLQNAHNQQETGESHRSRRSQTDLGIFCDYRLSGVSAGHPRPASDARSAHGSDASQHLFRTLDRRTPKDLLADPGVLPHLLYPLPGVPHSMNRIVEDGIAQTQFPSPPGLNACKEKERTGLSPSPLGAGFFFSFPCYADRRSK